MSSVSPLRDLQQGEISLHMTTYRRRLSKTGKKTCQRQFLTMAINNVSLSTKTLECGELEEGKFF